MRLNFYTKINEALKLSVAKEYRRGWNKERLADWFDGKFRSYVKLQTSQLKKTQATLILEYEITRALEFEGFDFVDFNKAIAKKTKDDKNQFKIGRLLNRFKRHDLLDRWQKERAQEGGEANPLVVISRHPYDIAGMSTDRDWTSCMNVYHGKFKNHVTNDCFISLIAYLIKPNDKNIQKPIARLLIKPYIGKRHEILYAPSLTVYNSPKRFKQAFINTVEAWLNDRQKKHPAGKYVKSPVVYADDLEKDEIFHISDNIDWRNIDFDAIDNKQFKELLDKSKNIINASVDMSTYNDKKFELPEGLVVKGTLTIINAEIDLPENLNVGGDLVVGNENSTATNIIKKGTRIKGNLIAKFNYAHNDFIIQNDVKIGKNLNLRFFSGKTIIIKKNVEINGNVATTWSGDINIYGNLKVGKNLEINNELTTKRIPPNIHVGQNMNLGEVNWKLIGMSTSLYVGGNLDIRYTGIKKILPGVTVEGTLFAPKINGKAINISRNAKIGNVHMTDVSRRS